MYDNAKIIEDGMVNSYAISAVVPVYNREKTIKRCIDSIINQTYPVFEIIVVDDGSKDKTLDIIEQEYGSTVTIIRQKHEGAQAARNAGIRAAQGQYIAFLDSDDEWLPEKIELQVQELYKNEDAVVCGDGYVQVDWENDTSSRMPLLYKNIFGIKKTNRTSTRKVFKKRGKSGNVYKIALKESFGDFDSLLIPRKSLMDIGLLDEKVPSFQEWDLVISLAKNNYFLYIRKPLFIYHLHGGETISGNPQRGIDGKEYICEKYKFEIMSQLGCVELTKQYQEIMRQCITYKDKRVIKYFFKYIAGRMHVFIFR